MVKKKDEKVDKKKTTAKFIEEEMKVVENDLDKIRTSPLMYISRVGSLGAIHLAKECINNNVDECLNVNSPGENIYINLNEDLNRFIAEDDGRGLPFTKMIDACTKIQSSTKFNRTSNQKSAGQNGAGLKCTNALSDYFKLDVWKLGEMATVEFKDGIELQSGNVVKCKDKEKHGTRVTFIPSKKYMGPCQMKGEDLMAWLNNIKHFLDAKITMEVEIEKKGKIIRHELRRSANGIADLVKEMSKSNHTAIVRCQGTAYVDEDVRIVESGGKVKDMVMNREIDLEFAFALNAERQEPMYRSFCNFVHTIDEGDHTTAVQTAICEYLCKKTRDILSEKEKEKYTIQHIDVTNSLVLALTVSTSMDPGFTGQTKEKIENSKFVKPLKDIVKNKLDEHFNDNPKELKRFTDVVKASAKARYDATKARTKVIKKEVGAAEHGIPNYFPANNKSKRAYREFFIFEGLSVKSNGTQARDPEYQAMFTMRGVPGEGYTMDSNTVTDKNEIFHSLVRAIGGGIGDNFNVNDCRFAKVIITSDGDIDGCFIFSLLGGFFLKHMKELILDGRLFLSLPPLYKIDDKKKPFVTDKKELQEVFHRRVVDKFEIREKGGKPLKKSEVLDFLDRNQYYLDELQRLVDHCRGNKYLVEYVVRHQNDKDFKKKFLKVFPEMTIEKDKDTNDLLIQGVCEGAFQIFTVDKLFNKKASRLREMMDKNLSDEYEINEKYSNGNIEPRGMMTVGEFLTLASKLQPAIKLRYKGLGELSEDDLWDTVMNPETRTLVQLTISDIEEAMAMYDVLHGKSKANLEARKEMTNNFEINLEMIDN